MELRTYKAVKVDGKKRDLHRMIAEKMLGRQLSPSEVVHHKDGNIHNNDPRNLQVMERSEHTRLHSRIKPANALLTPEKVRQIHKLEGTVPRAEIAKQFGVSKRAIEDIVWGQTWTWVQ